MEVQRGCQCASSVRRRYKRYGTREPAQRSGGAGRERNHAAANGQRGALRCGFSKIERFTDSLSHQQAMYHAAYVLKLAGHKKEALKLLAKAPRTERWSSALSQLESRCRFQCAIEMLPTELFIRVVALLPIRAVVHSSCVCRRWNRVVTLTPRLWRHVTARTPHISTVPAEPPLEQLELFHTELEKLYRNVIQALAPFAHLDAAWMADSHLDNIASRSWDVVWHLFGAPPDGKTFIITRAIDSSVLEQLGRPAIGNIAARHRRKAADDLTRSVLVWVRDEWRDAGGVQCKGMEEGAPLPFWAYLREDGEKSEEARPAVNEVWRNVCTYMAHQVAQEF